MSTDAPLPPLTLLDEWLARRQIPYCPTHRLLCVPGQAVQTVVRELENTWMLQQYQQAPRHRWRA
jgi:hypothetical protein